MQPAAQQQCELGVIVKAATGSCQFRQSFWRVCGDTKHKYLAMPNWVQIDRMDVFFKQRDDMFFPTWSFVVPTTMMRFPLSLVESFIWTVITYYPVGLAPQPSRYCPPPQDPPPPKPHSSPKNP